MIGRASLALEAARRAGAQQAAASVSDVRFVKATFRDGQLEQAKAAGKMSLGVRLYVDGRYGAHATSDLRDEALRAFVEGAVAMTRLLEPDPLRALPPKELTPTAPGPDLRLHDPAVAQAPTDFWLALARRMDELALERAQRGGVKLISRQGLAHGESGLELLATSDGFMGVQEETSCYHGCTVALLDDQRGGARQLASWHHLGRALDQMTDRARQEQVAAQAVERARRQLGGRPGPTGRGRLLVENSVAGRLVGEILGCLAGAALDQKQSYLADRLGQSLASPLLNMRDEPLEPGGLASRWFDGEGLAAQPRQVIEGGALRAYFLDTYYAKRLGLAPTAGSSTNLKFAPSRAGGFEQMLEDMPSGLAVTGFLGGNFNGTTGDFSFGVRGLWIENGRVAHPVEGMNIAGNYDDLWRSLAAVGDDPYAYSRLATPSLLFDEAMIAGA